MNFNINHTINQSKQGMPRCSSCCSSALLLSEKNDTNKHRERTIGFKNEKCGNAFRIRVASTHPFLSFFPNNSRCCGFGSTVDVTGHACAWLTHALWGSSYPCPCLPLPI